MVKLNYFMFIQWMFLTKKHNPTYSQQLRVFDFSSKFNNNRSFLKRRELLGF